MKTTKQTKVTLRTRTVGQCFGTVGQIVSMDDEVLAETGVRPYGFAGAALADAETLAIKHGYVVVEE